MHIIILIFGLAAVTGCSSQPESKAQEKAKPILVEQLADGSAWKNPVLRYDGDTLILNPGGKDISPDQIISSLNSLPARSWPQGRKVAIEAVLIYDTCRMLSPLRVKLFLENTIDLLQKNDFQPASWETEIRVNEINCK
ncbi:MAG: hypothetical protein CO113_13785 [Elusimicrobia bacterium CG_4_9_14_3_um_filter_62_55]|nr:MAG: hypothetical protein COR54_12110 [Elusimicrobia bacterium CG22_combo_CG10-13_8_21_14_all_63_91]PJA13225.1 MAG: hypothetical protein COX66_15335 [Elusimicrobia bacterium CG_4_10_14_0_2_um_filter_63_34]PJB24463.1 MAG: hypothetical protein CO113_13785 [Elusimicrobia bacterium CG_4_9_14_3_um_filter_62_55]